MLFLKLAQVFLLLNSVLAALTDSPQFQYSEIGNLQKMSVNKTSVTGKLQKREYDADEYEDEEDEYEYEDDDEEDEYEYEEDADEYDNEDADEYEDDDYSAAAPEYEEFAYVPADYEESADVPPGYEEYADAPSGYEESADATPADYQESSDTPPADYETDTADVGGYYSSVSSGGYAETQDYPADFPPDFPYDSAAGSPDYTETTSSYESESSPDIYGYLEDVSAYDSYNGHNDDTSNLTPYGGAGDYAPTYDDTVTTSDNYAYDYGSSIGNSANYNYKNNKISDYGNSNSYTENSKTQFQNVGDASYYSGNKAYSGTPSTDTTDSSLTDSTNRHTTDSSLTDSTIGHEEAVAESSSVHQEANSTASITTLIIPVSTVTPFEPITNNTSSSTLSPISTTTENSSSGTFGYGILSMMLIAIVS